MTEQHSYLVHGHGLALVELGNFLIPSNVELLFYCDDRQTTLQHGTNAAWPKLVQRFLTGDSLPTEHVRERRTNTTCRQLRLSPAVNTPQHGVYHRVDRPGAAPTCKRLEEIPPEGKFLLLIMNTIVRHAAAKGVESASIHYVACRLHASMSDQMDMS
jgi:hypothetical protein